MVSTVGRLAVDSVEAIREKATASAMISNTPGEITADMQVNYFLTTLKVPHIFAHILYHFEFPQFPQFPSISFQF